MNVKRKDLLNGDYVLEDLKQSVIRDLSKIESEMSLQIQKIVRSSEDRKTFLKNRECALLMLSDSVDLYDKEPSLKTVIEIEKTLTPYDFEADKFCILCLNEKHERSKCN